MSEDHDTLICYKCSRGMANVEASMAYCHECEEAVWVSNSSPRPIGRILCMECALAEIRQQHELVVRPMTGEQLEDIRNYFRKHGNA